MEKGTVSIIIPVYQAEKFLEKTVMSVLNQTYDKTEVVLVNDGSTDGSADICEKLSAKYKNIKVHHQNNKGVSSARNNGIDISTGEFILFLDSDDYLNLNTVKLLVEKLRKYEAEVVFYDFFRIYGDREELATSTVVQGLYESDRSAHDFLQLIRDDIANNIGTKLFKSSIIKNNKIKYNEEYMICEDLMFCVDYMSYTSKFYYLKKPMYYYVIQEENSLMSTYKKKHAEATSALFYKIKQYLMNSEQFDKVVSDYYDLLMDRSVPLISNEFILGTPNMKIIDTVVNNSEVIESEKWMTESHKEKIDKKTQYLNSLIWKKRKRTLYIIFLLLHHKNKKN